MGFLSSLLAAGPADQDPVYSWLTLPIAGGTKTAAGVHINEYNAVTIPAVYSAIGIIADAIAQLPLVVYQRTAAGRREATEHPAYRMLKQKANARDNAFKFRKLVSGHALGWGNGYAEIERNGRGQAVGLYPLLPDRTEARLADDGSGRLVFWSTVNKRRVVLDQDDVLHIMGYSHDGVVGLSPIDLAREALGLAKATQEFGAKFFGQGGNSGGLISLPPGANDDALKRVKKAWREQEGMGEAHRAKVLPDGATYEATTIPPEAAQFLQTRGFQIAEIARLYRVPLHMLQSHEKSTAWGSGLEQMFIAFIQTTLQPWLVPWEQEINNKVFTPEEQAAGFYVKFNVSALLRGDSTARADFYESAIRAGWMKRSEARELEDLNRIDGIDDEPINPQLGVAPAKQPPRPAPPDEDDDEEQEDDES